MKVLAQLLSRAACAGLLLSGCAAGDQELRQEMAGLRAEVRTLQRETSELSRQVDSLAHREDLAAARASRAQEPSPGGAAGAAPSSGAVAPAAAAAATGLAPSSTPSAGPAPGSAAVPVGAPPIRAEPLVPQNLKVVKLAPPAAKPVKGPAPAARAGRLPRKEAPPVPTSTPIRDPDPDTLAALGGSARDLAAEARSVLDAARAQTGLARARALEQFTAGYSGHASADDALVEAARTRAEAGDPDGACEDLARAVAEYPAGDALPEALAGLAVCEVRRGRPAEAARLETRLAKDFPDSPAARRTHARAAAAQGAPP